jgi:peptide deformylase
MKIVNLEEIPIESNFVEKEDLMNVYSICQKMQNLCLESGGVGLSAVQVGIPLKLFVYWDNFPIKPESFSYIADAKYSAINDEKSTSIESCLSIKNDDGSSRHFKLQRFKSIVVEGKILKDDKDKPYLQDFKKEFNENLFGIVFQHEIDHQNGILISQKGEEMFLKKL